MTEALFIRNKLKPYLKLLGMRVIKYHGSGFSESGVSDLLCCWDGRFVALEVKVGKNRPTKIQLAFIEDIRRHGGLAGVVSERTWADDLDDILYDHDKEL